ncbi:MAG: hypothetical protein EOO09_16295 [Chitinophagaceae bacterium]|nr:MAG: hypothetical protein EOO09_16295 [Chitinophagaceae bacterium]
MPATVALFMIIMTLSFFGCIFGIYYLTTRRNLAMIEKGMNPKEVITRPAPYKNLKWALLLVGSGAGLLVAFIIDINFIPHRIEPVAVYFALLAIGGGLGLFGSYYMEKKWWDENKHAKVIG